MATKGLTADEVVVILKACGDAQVSKLKFAGLYVEFSRNESSEVPGPGIGVLAAHVPATEIAVIQNEQADRSFAQAEAEHKEDQVAEMWLTDPAQAEAHLVNGDLDEESTDGEDEEA